MATKGAAAGTDIAADWAVYSEGSDVVRASVMEPWKFRRELIQQSGSEDEPAGAVLVLLGQHAWA